MELGERSEVRKNVLNYPASKLALILLRRETALFQRLSLNITREVASYLEGEVNLVALEADRLRAFNFEAGIWKEWVPLQHTIMMNVRSSYTVIRSLILVCGGGAADGACKYQIDNTAFTVSGSGAVTPLPNMNSGRCCHGLVFDPDSYSCYVFGGWSDDAMLSNSEMWGLQNQEWRELPPMITARASFNPCVDAGKVWICGGFTRLIELFEIATQTFSAGPSAFQESGNIITAIQTDWIVAISRTKASRYHLIEKTIESVQHISPLIFSNCMAVVKGRFIYTVCLEKRGCYVYEWGGQMQQIQYSHIR